MRRKDRELKLGEAMRLLALAKHGTLCLTTTDAQYPCAVPINCAVVDGALIFHGAAEGEKMAVIAKDPRATFVAVLNYEPVAEEFSARYESVIAKGSVEIVKDDQERLRLLSAFTASVFDVTEESIADGVKAWVGRTCVMRMSIDSVSGKRSPKA